METNPNEPFVPNYSTPPPMHRWDAVFSMIIGLFLILILPRIWQIELFHNQSFTFSDEVGNPLPYRDTVFFPGDLVMALFSVALIVEGLVLLFRRSRAMLAICFALIVLATLSNLAFLIYMMQKQYGFQIYSGLATVIGLYIAVHQWTQLRAMRS